MYSRYSLSLLVGLIALMLGVVTGVQASISSSAPVPDQDVPVGSKDFGKWKYDAIQVGPETYIKVSGHVNGKAALKALLDENKAQHDQLFQSSTQVPVTVLTQNPINTQDFTNFVQSHNLQVQSYTLIGQDTTGETITFFGAPVDGILFPQHILKAMVDNIQQTQNKTVTISGVVSIDVKVDIGTLKKLDKDPEILGVDVTPALALQDLVRQIPALKESSVHITAAPFYWEARQ